ncbi:MAG: class I SAM-dependent methyltransferase [Alphaproteobacteria bacterium]
MSQMGPMGQSRGVAHRTLQTRQTWEARDYQLNAGFVSEFGAQILSWLAPQPGERILDLGCGDGTLALDMIAVGAEIVGVDASQSMLDAARRAGVDAHQCSGEELDFETEFDAVFSNAALHWMTRPDAVSTGVFAALKPGGRFVAEMGGFGNVAAISSAMRGAVGAHGGDKDLAHPWYFPTIDEHGACLQRAGFVVERIELAARPTALPTGMKGWLQTFRQPFFDQYSPEKREAVLATVVDVLRPSLADSNGNWSADYVRLRFIARKPAV